MKLTIEDKFAHVAAWRNSGLVQRQYCELHQINIHTFRTWTQLLKKTLADSAAVPSPEFDAVEKRVAAPSNQMPNGIIPVKVASQTRADDVHLANPTLHSSQFRSQTKEPNLEYSSGLLAVIDTKPPPEISLILTSGLQIKCDVRLLSEVLQVVGHV